MTYDSEVTIKPEVLERYFAFHPGDTFNENLLSLSSRRIESDAVVSKSNFLTECEEGKLVINHRVSQGTTKLVQLGAGVSTEEIRSSRRGGKIPTWGTTHRSCLQICMLPIFVRF
ncbi:MAG: hypothetical protein R2877_07280 [Bdellovibrionota bacterium]